MTQFTAEQIGQVAWAAGVRDGPTLARAIAIALAESSGQTDAHNANAATGDDSYGLWGINMIGTLGPSRRKVLGLTSNAQLLDPDVNARAMWTISNQGKNWSPWSTFKNNAYLKYMATATTAANAVLAQPGKSGGMLGTAIANLTGHGGGLDIGGAITAFGNNVAQTFFRGAVNAGVVLVALVLLVVGVIILLRAPLERAAKQVVVAVPVGRRATAAVGSGGTAAAAGGATVATGQGATA